MRSRRIALVVGFVVATAIVGCEIEVPLDDGWFPDASIPPPDANASLPLDGPGSGSPDAGSGSGNGGDGGVVTLPDAGI